TLATGIIIVGQISASTKIINLEFKLSNLLGKYSYGIYIYHPLLLFLFAKMNLFASIENELAKLVVIFGVVVVATIGIAVISYEVFEKRFIKLKENFAIIHSSNDSRNKI
uniref:acyltransferase family protein n=1 Tax=Soonwooa sp. TaxID=1938592 RepID=UPI00289E8A42